MKRPYRLLKLITYKKKKNICMEEYPCIFTANQYFGFLQVSFHPEVFIELNTTITTKRKILASTLPVYVPILVTTGHIASEDFSDRQTDYNRQQIDDRELSFPDPFAIHTCTRLSNLPILIPNPANAGF